jgi:hypothetical protein
MNSKVLIMSRFRENIQTMLPDKAFQILEVLFIISLCFFHGKVLFIENLRGSPSDFLTFQIYPADILAILLILGELIRNFCLDKPKNISWGLTTLLVLELIISISPRGTFISPYYIFRFIECIGLFIYFFHVELKKPIYMALSFLGVIESFVGIIQFHLKHSIGLHLFGEPIINVFSDGIAKIDLDNGTKFIRAYGTFSHPNSLSAFLLIAFAATCYLIFNDKRLIYYVNLFLIIIGTTVTFSRAAFVALSIFIIGSVLTLALTKIESKSRLLYYGFAIFLGIIVSVASYGTFLNTRATITDASTVERIAYDRTGIAIAKENPFFGGGLGSVIYKVSDIMPKNIQSWMIEPPHNYFIIVSDETGIIGLIIFSALLIYILNIYVQNFRKIKSVANPTEILILFWLFISIIVIMQFDHYFYDIPLMSLLLWTILGIISGTASRNYAAMNNKTLGL